VNDDNRCNECQILFADIDALREHHCGAENGICGNCAALRRQVEEQAAQVLVHKSVADAAFQRANEAHTERADVLLRLSAETTNRVTLESENIKLEILVEEQAASLEKVTRSWEEQAAKLAEVLGRKGEDFKGLVNSLAAAQAALRAKDKAMEVARKWATNRGAHEVAEELARAIAVTPSPADGEPSFTMEELKAMKAKLDEPFPAPSEPKEGA
jgi:hypothetical protein